MNTLDKIVSDIFNLFGDYLEWLIIPMSDALPIPKMSLVVLGLWSSIFLFWFVAKSIQAGDDSKIELLLNRSRVCLTTVLIIFIVSIAASAAYVSTYLNHSDRTLNWLIHYLGKPLVVSFVSLSILSFIIGWFCLRNWIPAANRWITEKATKKS